MSLMDSFSKEKVGGKEEVENQEVIPTKPKDRRFPIVDIKSYNKLGLVLLLASALVDSFFFKGRIFRLLIKLGGKFIILGLGFLLLTLVLKFALKKRR